ncbi:E3 SUMO-protein ligase ZBED1-like [Haliotis rufescens]|uniref:E3 SUMO-protein ligase ZBED1-like n=1 Tax=Haliotis rufescens TaxID=6454 RepID=UPI00201E7ACA|nr:E3 SUMO-protein ligase ZBED1-like [Haliotis rufescens]
MVWPLLENLSQAMAPNVEDSQMKVAILNSLSKRNTYVEIKQVMLQASLVDPRFKALPFLNPQEKLKVQEFLLHLAKAMNNSSLEYVIIKSEPGAGPEDGIINPPKKTALSSLFGDVFVVGDVPATLTKKEQLAREIKTHIGEDSVDINTNPLKWWHEHAYNYPLLYKVAKYLLAIQSTSVPSERVFSTAWHIVTAQRATLAPENVDKLIFLKKNVIF